MDFRDTQGLFDCLEGFGRGKRVFEREMIEGDEGVSQKLWFKTLIFCNSGQELPVAHQTSIGRKPFWKTSIGRYSDFYW